MNPQPEEVGRRLRQLRLAWDFTQQNKWVEFLGKPITTQQWNNWERGRSIPDMVPARHIAMKAKVTTDWIWWGETAGLPLNMAQRLEEVARREEADPTANRA